jgi:hypothetical protein
VLPLWWKQGYEHFVEAFSGFNPENPEQVFRGVLHRNARTLVEASSQIPPVDQSGRLFAKICACLGASCYVLQVRLNDSDWADALADVLGGQAQLASIYSSVHSHFRSPAEALLSNAAQSLISAGVVPNLPVHSDPAAREASLRLAVHYLMRLLIAYARQCNQAEDPAVLHFQGVLAAAAA